MTKTYETIKLDKLKPYANNPRNNDNAVPAVKASIPQVGYITPIVVDENYEILAGHTRYKALKALGRKEAEILRVDGVSEEQKKKYRLLDNKTGEAAMWDFNALAVELVDLDFDGFDFGFDELLDDEGYGTDFELPDGNKSDMCQITFYLHEEQAELIRYAMSIVENEVFETFGNKNKHGNELYEVVRQWAEQRK